MVYSESLICLIPLCQRAVLLSTNITSVSTSAAVRDVFPHFNEHTVQLIKDCIIVMTSVAVSVCHRHRRNLQKHIRNETILSQSVPHTSSNTVNTQERTKCVNSTKLKIVPDKSIGFFCQKQVCSSLFVVFLQSETYTCVWPNFEGVPSSVGTNGLGAECHIQGRVIRKYLETDKHIGFSLFMGCVDSKKNIKWRQMYTLTINMKHVLLSCADYNKWSN